MKILFTGSNLRIRRRETILNPPKGIEFVTQKKLNEMSPDHKLSKNTNKNIKNKIINIFFKNHYLSKKQLQNIDLVYSPGKIIFNKVPWIIEIDNPICMSYYNLFLFNLLKPIINFKLKSKYCKKIICISEASKKSMKYYFKNKKIQNKISVVYPYVKLNKKTINTKKNKNLIFLSCNTKFFMKGTYSVISAFKKLNYKNTELWIISNTPKNIAKEFKSKNIKFFPAKLSKKELYDIYSKADIFIQPTLQDSFGLVYLEAIANRMAVISTDVYAIPEFVINNYNGLLIKAPFYMYNKNFSLKNKFFPIRAKDAEKLYKKYNYNQPFINSIYKKMKYLADNPNIIESMKKNSTKLIKSKFSEEKRLNKLFKIFN